MKRKLAIVVLAKAVDVFKKKEKLHWFSCLWIILLSGCTLNMNISNLAPAPLPDISVAEISLSLTQLPVTDIQWQQLRVDSQLQMQVKNNEGSVTLLEWQDITSIVIESITFSSHLEAGEKYQIIFRTRSEKGVLSAEQRFTWTAYWSFDVTALYPQNGSRWNSYIQRTSSTGQAYQQSDTLCDYSTTAGTSYRNCLHAGSLRQASSSEFSACTNLHIEDSLDVLKWRCRSTGSAIQIYSYGLKENKGLADLLDSSGWREVRLRLYQNGKLVALSDASPWWDNPIVHLQSKTTGTAELLDQADTIYVITKDMQHVGFRFGADGVALVLLSDTQLTRIGSVSQFISNDPNIKRIWLEGGRIEDESIVEAVYLEAFSYSTLLNLKIRVPYSNNSVHLRDAYCNRLLNISLVEGDRPLSGINASGNVFYRIRAAVSATKSVQLWDAYNNVLLDHIHLNSSEYGVLLVNGENNIVVGMLGASNTRTIDNTSPRLTATHITSIGAFDDGLRLSSDNSTVVQAVAVNTQATIPGSGHGFEFLGNNSQAAQLVTTDNRVGVLVSGNSNVFQGALLVGNNTIDCSNSGTGNTFNSGDTICTHASPNLNVWPSTDALSSIEGQVMSDAINPDGSNLDGLYQISFPSISSFLEFENPWRTFIGDNFDSCQISSDICEIWDFRWLATSPLTDRSGNGSTPNASFVSGATCPSAVHGNRAIIDFQSNPNTFLVNAKEVFADDYGDDDGLCESNEHCIYSPNFGAYQGEGDLVGPCLFSDGTVSGVTMYAYQDFGS